MLRFKSILMMTVVVLGTLLTVSNLYAIPIAGGSSGVFVNPAGPSGMVTTGVGTGNFTWGTGYGTPSSSLSFSGNTFSADTDDVFSFGTLTYYNGTILLGTEADSVDLDVTLALTIPSGITQNFSYTLGLINTPNTGTAEENADYVNFNYSIPNTYFTTGGINYTLEFLGFGTISGSGFSTVDQFHVLEDGRASAELLGRITYANVPEPSALLLLGSGLVGLAGMRRRFKD